MNKIVNLSRYAVGLALPLCFASNPLAMLVVFLIMLLLNNVLDDVIFYVGNSSISSSRYNGGLASPVNGIVTMVENGVPLFNHIEKTDSLTRVKYHSIRMTSSRKEGFYHAAVFLNKFSHHIVINPSRLLSVERHYCKVDMNEMVKSGSLLSDNEGAYLNNDALILRYCDCFIVLTLDKYVSDYIRISDYKGYPSVVICRGSQCDIYSEKPLIVKEGQKVEVFESLTEGNCTDDIRYFSCGAVNEAISHVGGLWKIVKDNALKTLSTYQNIPLAISMLVGIMAYPLSTIVSYVAFSWTYLFVWIRFYRHFMYALMNVIGYRKWMTSSYGLLNKVSVIWQMKS